MQRLRQLVVEAHRRSLWQVLGIYIFGAWAVYEIIAEITDRIGLPDWVPGFAIVLFLIGLPIVLATAFVQEGLPGQPPKAPQTRPADAMLVPEFESTHDFLERRSAPAASMLAARQPHVFLTWQRAVAGGVVAFLLLGITAGGYMGLRNAGIGPFASLITAGELDARDRIIVAQLAHAAGDTVTADAVTEALRVDLTQSPVLTLVEGRFIGEALQRMGRSPDERLTGAVAREVAIREGITAVLEGDISPAGSGVIITARLVRPSTGEALMSHRETARGDDDVIPAIDRLSSKLREGIGESLRTVRATPPLERVSTGSLSALQKYTQGVYAQDRERDYDRSIRLLEEAIALDSTFAMAWRKLAVAFSNTRGGAERVRDAGRRAYELRDRLTERERYHTVAYYHLNVTGDDAAAIQAYRTLLDTYPTDHAALNNLGLAYGRLGDDESAVDYYRRALAVDSSAASTWTNLMQVEYRLGRKESARELLDQVLVRFPGQFDNRAYAAYMAHADGRYEEAERILREVMDASRGSHTWQARTNFFLGFLHVLRGRYAASQAHFRDGVAANRARGVPDADLQSELMRADMEQWVLQRPDLALRRVDAVRRGTAWLEAGPLSRDYLRMSQIYSRSGNSQTGQDLLDAFLALPAEERGDQAAGIASAHGWVAMAEGRPADAIPHFREAIDPGECAVCGLTFAATAFEAAGVPDSAIAYYERYIATPQLVRIPDDGWDLAYSYERLAGLYETKGDGEMARRYAGLFIDLWQDADPELQPRVRRMQELLDRLRER
jgi:eukaryotic-like serine/threonine-protein kinase